MKLWDKGYPLDGRIESFTVGKDRELDLFLAPYDIEGTIAHVTMLQSVGLLEKEELEVLLPALEALHSKALAGKFTIDEGVEDVHSQVEFLLTEELGEVGKKVHSGRSRNDQVLVDLKLFARSELKKTRAAVKELFDTLLERSEATRDILMPGYTHLQVAMPSSFGLWFGAYAESLCNDMELINAAMRVVNRNPLGSAAGYGSSAPLDRDMTTSLLHFDGLDVNSVYAQMSRGKTERIVSFAMASAAETVGRLAMDCCLFGSQNFGFVHLPDLLTTGSSIMPHKKNPDVFELLRARCNRINSIPEQIRMITGNLPSGYFRDMQLVKEIFIPMFAEMDDCLSIASYAVRNLEVKDGLMDDPLYQQAFSVEEVNRRVSGEGIPFRDAYRSVGKEIQDGTFVFKGTLHHTHQGSIGNLCNERIRERMEKLMDSCF